MSKRLALKALKLTCILPLCVFPFASKAEMPILHDIVIDERSHLQISGNDAYLVTELLNKSSNVDNTALSINLPLIESELGDQHPIRLEVFFKSAPSDALGDVKFDPNYRLRIQTDKAALADTINIRVPNDIKLNQDQIRIDIDGCNDCVFSNAGSVAELINLDTLNNDKPVLDSTRTFNGIRNIPDNGYLLDVATATPNDVKLESRSHSEKQLEVTGDDPYLRFDQLDLSTDNLGGVQFELRSPNSASSFQVFYSTEHHAFNESATAFVRAQRAANGSVNFVLPLDFLSQSTPPAQRLDGIRLDLDRSETGEQWIIQSASIITKSALSELDNSKAQIVLRNNQRVGKRALIGGIFKRLGNDMWFVVSYLLLIALTCFGFWRSFKR